MRRARRRTRPTRCRWQLPWTWRGPRLPDPRRAKARQAAAALVHRPAAARPTGAGTARRRTRRSGSARPSLLLDEMRRRRVTTVDVAAPGPADDEPDRGARARIRTASPPRSPGRCRAGRSLRPGAVRGSIGGSRNAMPAVPLLDPEDLPGSSDLELSDDDLAAAAGAVPGRRLGRASAGRGRGAVRDGGGWPAGAGPDRCGLPRRRAGADTTSSTTRPARCRRTSQRRRCSWRSTGWRGPTWRVSSPSQVRAGFLYVRTMTVKRPERLLDRAELAELLGTGAQPFE